jgi:hypothetical protein
MMEANQEVRLGDSVEIIDTFSGRESVVCRGNVDRLTKTLAIIRTEHGSEVKYRLKDKKQVGYSWPYLTHAFRVVNTVLV